MALRPKRRYKPPSKLKDFVILSDQDKVKHESNIFNTDQIVSKKLDLTSFVASSTKSYTCIKCLPAQKFPSKIELKSHLKTHKNGNSYLCEDCGKSLSSLQSFTEHVNIHKNIKPYKCEYCNRESRQFSVHYRHLLTHNNDPLSKHKCSICSKSFKLKEYLRRHVVKHLVTSDKILYKCDECPKSFNENRALKRHKISHSSVKQFNCTYCNKKFKMKHNLQSHLKAHTGLQTWTCNQCSAQFHQQSFLEAHKKTHKELIQNVELAKTDSKTIHVTAFPLDRRKVSQYQKVSLPKDFSLDDQEQLKKSKLTLCLNDVVFPLSVVANSFGTGTHIKVKIIDPKPQISEKSNQTKKQFNAFIAEKESLFKEGDSSDVLLQQQDISKKVTTGESSSETVEEINEATTQDKGNINDKFHNQVNSFEESFNSENENSIVYLEEIVCLVESMDVPFDDNVCSQLQNIISTLQSHLVNLSLLQDKHMMKAASEGKEDQSLRHQRVDDKTIMVSTEVVPQFNKLYNNVSKSLEKERFENNEQNQKKLISKDVKRYYKCYRNFNDSLHKHFAVTIL